MDVYVSTLRENTPVCVSSYLSENKKSKADGIILPHVEKRLFRGLHSVRNVDAAKLLDIFGQTALSKLYSMSINYKASRYATFKSIKNLQK